MDRFLFIGWIPGLIGFLIAGASHAQVARLEKELKRSDLSKND